MFECYSTAFLRYGVIFGGVLGNPGDFWGWVFPVKMGVFCLVPTLAPTLAPTF